MRYLIAILAISAVVAGCRPASTQPQADAAPTPVPPPAVPVRSVTPNPAPTPGEGIVITTPIEADLSKFADAPQEEWVFIDPAETDVPTARTFGPDGMKMRVLTGRDLYADNLTAPRLVRSVKGDLELTARVSASPKENYQGAGLLIYADAKNYIRFERSHGGVDDADGNGIRLDVRLGDEYRAVTTPRSAPFTGSDVELRLVRIGSKIRAFYRGDEKSPWKPAGEIEAQLADNVFAGVIGCNTGGEFNVGFRWIRLAPADEKTAK